MTGTPVGAGVTYVVPRYLPRLGGIEVHVDEVSRRVAAHRDVMVVSQDHDPPPGPRRTDAGVGIRIHRGTRDLLGQGVSGAAWRDVRRAWPTDRIIHLQNVHAASTALVVRQPRRRRGGPLVVTPHYLGIPDEPRLRALHAAYRPLAAPLWVRADAVICVSDSEADLLAREQGVDRARITVIPNGVDTARLAAGRDLGLDHRALVVAGRLLAYKGHDAVIRALPHLPADVHLHVLGDGPTAPQLGERAAALGLTARVHLHGRLDPVALADWYASAAAVVSLSDRECFGMSLLEGVAAGAPVLGSDIPAHREVLAMTGVDEGALVRLGAPAEEVAAGLTAAIARGRHAPGTHWAPTWDHVAARHLELYAALEAGSDPSRRAARTAASATEGPGS